MGRASRPPSATLALPLLLAAGPLRPARSNEYYNLTTRAYVNFELIDGTAQDCNTPADHVYCVKRCVQMYVWLGSGLGLTSGYEDMMRVFEEYSQINMWAVCPYVYYVVKFLHLRRLVLEPISPDSPITELGYGEVYLKTLFMEIGMNLTMYLWPKDHTTPGLFHALHQLVLTIEDMYAGRFAKRPEEGSHLETLRKAIDRDIPTLPRYPYDGFKEQLEYLRTCSIDHLAFGLVDAVEELGIANQRRLGDRHIPIGTSPRWKYRLNIVQDCVAAKVRAGMLLWEVLFTGSPLFGLLDRLETASVVKFDMPPDIEARFQGFLMHVMPVRDHESNFVRSRRMFHCDMEVKNQLIELHKAGGEEGLVTAEVGAYLGGCSFWAVSHLRGTSAVAVEQFGPAAEAMRRTVRSNRMEDRFRVVEACVSDVLDIRADAFAFEVHDGIRQPALSKRMDGQLVARSELAALVPAQEQEETEEEPTTRRCVTLPEALMPELDYDVVRIHTSHFEMPILRSAKKLIAEGRLRIRVIIIMLTHDHLRDNIFLQITELLILLGARVGIGGRAVRYPEPLESAYSIMASIHNFPVALVAEFNQHKARQLGSATKAR